MIVFLDYAWKILFVVFFFGLCIFVHELGHLLVALWRGLYVERFSIGFGKKIWGVTYKGVEYVIGWLPFGGYVALPQLEPADVPTDSKGNELPVASAGNRAMTAVSGPVANVLFGFFLATITWIIGVYEPAPAAECTVWEVPQILPLGKDEVKPDDRIIAMDGRPVSGTWTELSRDIPLDSGPLRLRVRRGEDETFTTTYEPVPNPEYVAGLRKGDTIVAVNGDPITKGWQELSEAIVLNTNDVSLTVVHEDGERETVTYTPSANPAAEGLGYPFFSVVQPTVVDRVLPDTPADRAGLKKGDRLLAVDDKTVRDQSMFVDLIQNSAGKPLDITVSRDGSIMTLEDIQPEARTVEGRTDYLIGVALGLPRVLGHPNPWEQFVDVMQRTKRTLGSLFAPMRGQTSLVRVGHMSGPVGILGMIWFRITTEGLRGGLAIIIIVTFSLAFFNLLPIPVLDGGHILFSFVEVLIRRRIPTRVVVVLQYMFAYLLIGLMLYITFRDVLRIPKFIRAFTGSESTQEEPAEPGTAPAEPTSDDSDTAPVEPTSDENDGPTPDAADTTD